MNERKSLDDAALKDVTGGNWNGFGDTPIPDIPDANVHITVDGLASGILHCTGCGRNFYRDVDPELTNAGECPVCHRPGTLVEITSIGDKPGSGPISV